jgi:integrase
MPPTLYRRHRKGCEASHMQGSFTGQFEEARRGAKRCSCAIHVSGTLAGRFNRKQVGSVTWDQAREIAAQWEARGAWVGSIPPGTVVRQPEVEVPRGVTVIKATDAFLAKCHNRGIQASTFNKYRTFAKQLSDYAIRRGYVFVSQLTVVDMDRFYASWKDAKRAKAKKLERLKSFVKFCAKREWLARDLVEDLEPPQGSSIPAHKTPFTDAELERIYAVCHTLAPVAPGPGHRIWTGDDVEDFVLLSICTGMRISDVATFDLSKRLKGNDVFLRMHKTRKELYTWIPEWLAMRLRNRAANHGPVIFITGKSLAMGTITNSWRKRLNKVFALAGPFDERPTPHRFRHTFVRMPLNTVLN